MCKKLVNSQLLQSVWRTQLLAVDEKLKFRKNDSNQRFSTAAYPCSLVWNVPSFVQTSLLCCTT